MRQEFREGDWVRHRSCPEPIRVIGIGTTIAVQFPNGVIRAYEPSELEKVPLAEVPVRKVPVQGYRQDLGPGSTPFAFVTSISLICMILLVLVVIATVKL